MIDEPKPKTKTKILVIEDEVSLQNALHEKFILEGFDVVQAKSGDEGLATAISLHPDIILLDIILPKMDGLTMMMKLRQSSGWGKYVPIILLTNLSADNDKINQAIVENEPAYYLVKSEHTINELVEKVRERLSRQ